MAFYSFSKLIKLNFFLYVQFIHLLLPFRKEHEKHLNMMKKRLKLHRDSVNIPECLKLLNWFTSPEAVQFYPPTLLPNQNSILKEQFNLMTSVESTQIAKDIENGRMRLAASDPLERLIDRCHVQNYSKELTQVIRKLSEIEPDVYVAMLIARLSRIALSDFCANEELRIEYAAELKALILCHESNLSAYIKHNLYTGTEDENCTYNPESLAAGPRDILISLKAASNSEDHGAVLKLFEDLERVCKRWNRAFNVPEYLNFIQLALKLKLKALIASNYNEDALELCGKFRDEDLLDDIIFEPVLLILESFGNYSRAITLIESKLMQIDPEHPGIILRLVEDLIASKRFEEAEGYLEAIKEAYKLNDIDPETQARISFATGQCYWSNRITSKADTLAHFLAAAKANPNESKYFTWIGKFYWRIEGESERAKKCFIKALNLDPSNFQAALLYAEISLANNETDACTIVDLLKPFTKQSFNSRNRKLFYFYGVALFNSKNFLDSSVAFQSALKSPPVTDEPRIEDENCLQWLGESYMRSNRLGSAAKAFTGLASSSIYGNVGLASVHLKSNNPIEAVDALDSISLEEKNIKISLDKSEALIALARHYLHQGRFISAMKSLLRALNTLMTVPCACAYRMAADCLVLAHLYRHILGFPLKEFMAYAQFTSLTVNPGLSVISEALETITIEKESFDICVIGAKFALAAISEAFNSKKQAAGVMAIYWLQLAVSLSKFDQLNEFSISAAETALKSENCPESTATESHHLLALIHCKNPQSHRLAQHHFISALKCKESSLIWIDLGRFYMKAGDWELAGEAFKRALAVDPEDLVAAFELAKCGGSLEGICAARQVAQRAFSTQPVLFTKEFASTLVEYDNPLKEIAGVYLFRLEPQPAGMPDAEEIPNFTSKSDLLAYLNDKSVECRRVWLSPAAHEFDCEFLLKRPENELTQSGWRAVVEGLLPGSKERTNHELEELAKK